MMTRTAQLSIFFFFLFAPSMYTQVIFVDASATGNNDGSDWTNAFADLNAALDTAVPGDSVWVAQGTYFPTADNDRSKYFELKDGVKLFGGFAGNEQFFSERDWASNLTVLSGDIGLPGDSTDNSHTILYMQAVDTSTCVDGFFFRSGNADGNGSLFTPSTSGGAIYVDGEDSHAYPRIRHCSFEHNHAESAGGAVYVNGQDDGSVAPQFFDYVFRQNSAQSGGGIYRDGGSWEEVENDFWNCRFEGNRASQYGGGVLYFETERTDTIEFRGCDFTGNESGVHGGGLCFFAGRGTGTKAILSECEFDSNNAGGNGGELYFAPDFSISNTDFLTIHNCDFLGNDSVNSSTVAIVAFSTNFDESAILIQKCLFENYMGVPLRVGFENKVEISDTEWKNNPSGKLMHFSTSNEIIVLRNRVYRFVGGALFGFGGFENLIISNTIFEQNQQIFNPNNGQLSEHNIQFTNCTFSENSTVFLNPPFGFPNHHYFFQNCIFSDSTDLLPFQGQSMHIENSLVKSPDCASIPNPNLTCGPGMLYALDPMFLDTAAGDYRLHPCSPARNAGSNAVVDSLGITADIAGDERIQEGTVDMGAFEMPPFAVSLDSIGAVACGGSSTGSFTVSVTSGCGPFTVDFGGVSTVADSTPFTLTDLPAGPYQINVIDSEGREQMLGFEIPGAPPLDLGITATDVDCTSGTPASATATASGGTGGTSYLWSNGDTLASTGGLPTGEQWLTVTDSLGCALSDTFQVDMIGQLPLSGTATDVSCFGFANGTAAATPSGAFPHSWLWQGGQVDSLLTDLPPGSYAATVTDALGCSDSLALEISEPDTLTLALLGADTLCHGAEDGALAGLPTGGTPGYFFQWENGETDSLLTNLPPGEYLLTVTDANGCSATANAVLGEALPIEIEDTVSHATGAANADGSIEITATTGGTPPYAYLWDTGDTTASLENLPTGSYSLTVTDADSCQQVFGFFVDVKTAVLEALGDGLRVGISPNPARPDGLCQLLIESSRASQLSARLANAEGRTLWTATLSVAAGTGSYRIAVPQVAGVYFLVLENEDGRRPAFRLVVQ